MQRTVGGLIILVAVGMACGHIVSAQRVYEPAFHKDETDAKDRRPLWPKARPSPLPIYGSNDRSRWATVRALVDEGTYVIGKRDVQKMQVSAIALFGQLDPLQAATLASAGYFTRVSSDSGIIFEDGWQSVDKVLDPTTLQYYSSKPPLLATLVAGLYWLLHLVTGWSFSSRPNEIIRTLLLIINGVPFAIYLWQVKGLVETWGKTDWGKLFVLGAGAFGTLVTPFLITFNNHTVATFSVMFAWLALLRIGNPSLTLAGQTRISPPWCLFGSAGFFSAFAAANELPALAFTALVLGLLLWWHPGRTLLFALPPALLVAIAFFATNYAALGTWRVAYSNTESVWYQYEGSHWARPDETKFGIDWARKNPRDPESVPAYAFHALLGHHGWFSMTPVWLAALAAMLLGFRLRSGTDPATAPSQVSLPWFVHSAGLLLSLIVVGFYLWQSDNYGGFTNGLRWLMWLTPIWLTCLLPAADWLAESRWRRIVGYLLLGVSVFSASYQPWNPWRHPWIYDLMRECGWPGY
jgi:hypothetical protein